MVRGYTGVGARGWVYFGCVLLGSFTIINIYIVTILVVVLHDMFDRVWLAEPLEVLADAASLVVRRMVSLAQSAFGR